MAQRIVLERVGIGTGFDVDTVGLKRIGEKAENDGVRLAPFFIFLCLRKKELPVRSDMGQCNYGHWRL